MDPMVGSAACESGAIISDSSDNADLLDFCFLCSRQFFHENLDNYGTERIKDEDILETFFEELGPVDRSLLQCCPTCKVLCKTLLRTKEALASLIDEITSLLLRSRKVSYLLSKSRVVSRLFQSSNSSLPPGEISQSYLQQPLSQINFVKDASNDTNAEHSFDAPFDMRLDTSNLSVGDSLYLGLSQSITTSVIKKSPLSKSKREKPRSTDIPTPTSTCPTSFTSILNESIMNSVSDNACDASENVISCTPKKSCTANARQSSITEGNQVVSKSKEIAKIPVPVITKIFSEASTPDKEGAIFSSLPCSAGQSIPISKTDLHGHMACDTRPCHKTETPAPEVNPNEDKDCKEREVSVAQALHGIIPLLQVKCHQHQRLSSYDNSKNHESDNESLGTCKKHVKRKLSKYKCNQCNKYLQSSTTLKNHLSAHNQERKYICEICGTSYRHKIGLEAHVAIHNGEPKFQCDICRKIFTQKAGLQRHMRIHTGKHEFQCDTCGKQFLHHTSFRAHKLMHDGIKKYACAHCSLAFSLKSHLQRHFKVHTGEKPHKCHLCERSFAEKYNLHVHLKSHEKSPTFSHKCSRCGKGFTRKFKLKKHLHKVHDL